MSASHVPLSMIPSSAAKQFLEKMLMALAALDVMPLRNVEKQVRRGPGQTLQTAHTLSSDFQAAARLLLGRPEEPQDQGESL